MTGPEGKRDGLKRLLRWQALPYAVLAAGIVVLAAVAYLIVAGLDRDSQRFQAEYRDNLPWYAGQFEREMTAFLVALESYRHPDYRRVTKDDLMERLDVFQGRLDSAATGTLGAAYMSFEGARPLIEETQRVMRDIEPMVAALDPEDDDAYRLIKESLRGLPADFHNVSLRVLHRQNQDVAGMHRRRKAAQAKLLVIFAGVLAGGAILIGLILLELRRIDALRASLERRFEERTRDLRREIAGRQQAMEALRDSEQRFRDFAGSASDWFWELGPDLRFSYLSERFEPATGIAPDRVLGKAHHETGQPVLHDQVWIKHLEDMAARRPFRDCRLAQLRRNGETVYVSLSGTPRFDETGAFLGYRGTGANITERVEAEKALRRSEERYRRLVDLSPDGILIHLQDRIAFANPAAVKLLGAKSADDLIGRSMLDFVDPRFHKIAKLRIKEVLDRGREQPQMEQVFVGLDGRSFPTHCSATRLPREGGRAVLTVFRDITQVKRIEV
ncbi:MAG: PAS domain S-box protein [Proteobacteria bacterium]|nr:PAS domain S-box protein [Pseudomonadota bacterium]